MEILENLICLNLEGTLAYETGIMLNEAEKYYGQRNLNYTLLGFEFSSRDIDYSPCIRYHNTTQIIINLTKSCAQDRYQSIFQMSHEIIHVLGPSGNDSSTVLEEGLATHFQFLYMKNFHDYKYDIGNKPEELNYLKAMKEIEKINNLENGAIIKLREKIKTFNDINEHLLINTFPEISIDSAKILCEKFTYT